MISSAGTIRTLIIDLKTLKIQSRYWDMLAPKYQIVFMERFEEDGHLLLWSQADGRSVTYSYTDGHLPVRRILDTAEEMTGNEEDCTCVVTGDRSLQKESLRFSCVCFGVGGRLSFAEAHQMPDYYLASEGLLFDTLLSDHFYYPGEAAARGLASAFPPAESAYITNGISLPVYTCGRYFGCGHFLHGDPYTRYLQRVMDKEPLPDAMVRMLIYAANIVCKKEKIDAVLSIPPKPGQKPKFKEACQTVAEYCDIENMDTALFCCRDYPPLFSLEREERIKAVSNAFRLRQGYSYKKTILVLDDVTSSGATFEEAAQILLVFGEAKKVCLLTMAIAQIPITIDQVG